MGLRGSNRELALLGRRIPFAGRFSELMEFYSKRLGFPAVAFGFYAPRFFPYICIAIGSWYFFGIVVWCPFRPTRCNSDFATACSAAELGAPRVLLQLGPVCWQWRDRQPFGCELRRLMTRPFDVPQSMDQSDESEQHEDQDVPVELQPDPRPDHRTDRTEARLSRPTRQPKADGQARIHLGRANSDPDHSYSLLARLPRTTCTGDCTDDLSSLVDQIMDFSFGYFSKARILKLSKDLGYVETQLVRSERPATLADSPVHVLIISPMDSASSDASGQEPNGHFD
ncbi:hypothetical protein F2Q68_00009709 [Brassica cretica]|uniref:Uncharacterized protein n=1 Tax=Brassica cretica TaxID=69181 RepID=A0A8S9L500_BRACR|nr:hypothetical protein F2Q68_00009709 [Brassica cretica]